MPPVSNAEQNDTFNLETDPFETYNYQPDMNGYMQQRSIHDGYFYDQQQVIPCYIPDQGLARMNSNEIPTSRPPIHTQGDLVGPTSIPAPSVARVGQSTSDGSPSAHSVSESRTGSTSSICQMSEDALATHLGDLRISGVGHGTLASFFSS